MTPPRLLTERKPAVPESVPALRRAAADFAQASGAPESVVSSVKLAVTEAVTNAVIHAYLEIEVGEVQLEGWREAGTLIITVCDDGRGMRPRVDSPGLGMGLPLIAQMADEVDVIDSLEVPGTRLQMRFALTQTRACELSAT